MANLIVLTRRKVGDKNPTAPYWTDEEIEAALDVYRTEARYTILTTSPTAVQGISPADLQYLDFYDVHGMWEDDVVLVDSTRYAVLTPILSENTVGHWRFASPGQIPPVYISGKFYDVYAAAADLLDDWLADPDGGTDFTTEGGASFKVDQIRQARSKQRDRYRALSQPRVTRTYSSEDLPDYVSWPTSMNTGLAGDYYAP